MSLYGFETLERSPAAAETLAVLAEAIGGRTVPAPRRVVASADSHNPDEGLALLNAYIAVADPAVRQAILDAVLALTAKHPYR